MRKNIIKLSIILLIIFIIGVFFIGLNKNSIYDTKDLVGQKITNIQLDHFSENRIITVEDLKKNDFTLINFWASWCAPCRDEHAMLHKFNNAEKNLNILGLMPHPERAVDLKTGTNDGSRIFESALNFYST